MPNCHELLHQNLLLLHELAPGSPDFRQCVKENMFAQPNRTGFIQVLHYLCNTYDTDRYSPKVPWPILDRDQERTFRQNSAAFVKEVIKEVPEAKIPPFAPSFLSTPGGERFATFMWKFSLLVLLTVVERESDTPVIRYPTNKATLQLVRHATERNLSEIKQRVDNLYGIIIDASTHAEKLSNNILNQMSEMNSLRAELTELIGNCSLPEHEKSILLNGDEESSNAVLKKWQADLNHETAKARAMLDELQNQTVSIKQCYESVKILVNCQTMPVILDASPYLQKFEHGKRILNLADILCEAADAVCILMKSLSLAGGFQSFCPVLPTLHNIGEQMQKVADSLAETHAGYSELISQSLTTLKNNDKDGAETSPSKGRLLQAYEMLQEAQTSTPPLVFNIPSDLPPISRIGSQSPPVGAIVERMRFPSRLKPISENGSATTPTAPRTTSKLGLPSRTLVSKIPTTSLLVPKKGVTSLHSTHKANRNASLFNVMEITPNGDVKSTNGSHKLNGDAPVATVMETPANFHPQQTSTAYKPVQNDTRNGNHLALLKGGSNQDGSFKKSVMNPASSNLQHTVRDLHLSKSKEAETCSVPKPLTLFPEDIEETLCAQRKDKSASEARNQDTLGSTLKIRPEDRNTEDGIARSKMLELVAETLAVGRESDDIKWKQSLKSEELLKTAKSPNLPKITATAPPEVPKMKISECSINESIFDSPRLSLGMSSPPASADGSFFSTDLPDDNPPAALSVSHFDLNFEDEISPSGRVSLCPPSDMPETSKLKERAGVEGATAVEAPPATRVDPKRKSLLAIIHRYHELVASSKQCEIQQVSPPSSPIDLSSEDVSIGIDTKIEGLDDIF